MSLKGLISRLLQFRWNWLQEAYLTYKYVDEYNVFPAFYISKGVKLKISKSPTAKLIIREKLFVEKWKTENAYATIYLGKNSKLLIEKEFIVGDGVKLHVANDGELILRGKKNSSGSGITANSVVLARRYIEIGYDCIIAWDTFITDGDWHRIEGKVSQVDTILSEKVWVGVGVKILKGATINRDSIVAANSVVLKGIYPAKSLLSGNPANIVQENIPIWHRE